MSTYTSRYIQLTDYILLEYRYTDVVSPELFNYSFTRISNSYTSAIQLLNVDSAISDTNNVQERSVVQIAGNKFVDLDKDQVPTYLTYDASNLSTTTVTGSSTPYDTIRYHLLAGYNFEDLDGIIMQVKARERSGKDFTFSQVAFLKDSDFFSFNAKPIFLGERLYDRYVEVKIPAVKQINDAYYALEGNPSQSSSLVARLTSNTLGFLRAQPLKLSVIEIKSTTDVIISGATYKNYTTGSSKTVSINQSDDFASFAAEIRKSTAGDYFEYFGTWNGEFIEDFILQANSMAGNDYALINEIRVYEQVGSQLLETYNQQSIQDSDFDKPNLFRPVLLNGSTASSYSIEYTCRLYNKADSSQIIRIASLTAYDPKTWGKSLQRLEILNAPEAHKIYNKLVDGPTLSSVNSLPVSKYNTKYVPTFFDRSLITIHKNTAFLDNNGLLRSDRTENTRVVFAQGEATIVINPFDNFFMFTVLKTDGHSTPVPLDLGHTARYFMVFVGNDGKKIRVEQLDDNTLGNTAHGDILFKIPESIAEKIITFKTRDWWIVSRFDNSSETSIYQGKFGLPGEIEDIKKKIDTISASQQLKAEEAIRSIEVKANELQAELVKKNTSTKQSTRPDPRTEIPGMANDVVKTKTSYIATVLPQSQKSKPASSDPTKNN